MLPSPNKARARTNLRWRAMVVSSRSTSLACMYASKFRQRDLMILSQMLVHGFTVRVCSRYCFRDSETGKQGLDRPFSIYTRGVWPSVIS